MAAVIFIQMRPTYRIKTLNIIFVLNMLIMTANSWISSFQSEHSLDYQHELYVKVLISTNGKCTKSDEITQQHLTEYVFISHQLIQELINDFSMLLASWLYFGTLPLTSIGKSAELGTFKWWCPLTKHGMHSRKQGTLHKSTDIHRIEPNRHSFHSFMIPPSIFGQLVNWWSD